MSQIKKVTLVSASPKVGEPSVSGWLSDRAKNIMGDAFAAVQQISVRQSLAGDSSADYETMLSSDALVFIFPLYIFCMPGLLTRFLQDYYAFFLANKSRSRTQRIYCAVNCGFPEAGINEEAVRVVRSFSGKIGADFRFGLMIGGGGMLLNAHDAPFLKKTLAAIDEAFIRMKVDILASAPEPVSNLQVQVNFPRRLYFTAASMGWVSSAKKFNLKKKALYAKPYV